MRWNVACSALRRTAVDRGVRRAVVIVLSLRVVLGAVGWLSLLSPPPLREHGEWSELITSSGAWWYGLVAPWQRFDALWYQHIATFGYRAGHEDASFYPLYPLLERALGSVMWDGFAIAGLVISTAAMMVALALVQRLVAADLGSAIADRAVLYLALAPTAFFLLAPYAEALFLALSVGSLLAARRRRWAAAGAIAALAVLTRPAGLLLLAPLLVEAAIEMRDRRSRGMAPVRAGHAFMLAPVAAWAGYQVYAITALRLPAGVLSAEHRWGQHLAAPWTTVADSVRVALSGSRPEEVLNITAVLALAVAVALMWRRLPPSWSAYSALTLVGIVGREADWSPLMSAARFICVLFPVFALVAIAGRRRWINRAVVATLAICQVALMAIFAHFGFVG